MISLIIPLNTQKYEIYSISTYYFNVPVLFQYDPEGDDNDMNSKKRKKIKGIDPKDMTDEQRLERRLEHAYVLTCNLSGLFLLTIVFSFFIDPSFGPSFGPCFIFSIFPPYSVHLSTYLSVLLTIKNLHMK